jgi:hypothetical protein
MNEFEGIYLHKCPDADFAVIDEHDDEILKCRCFNAQQFLDAQDKRAVAIDVKRGEKA